MQKIVTFLKKPYTEKGLIVGSVDLLVKLVVLCVWCYLTVVLARLFIASLLTDYNPMHQLWWFSYCFLMFFGLSWLSYIAFFLRDYNEEE